MINKLYSGKMEIRPVLILLFLFTSMSFAQYYEESSYSGVGLPYFEYSLNRQFSSDFKNSKVILIAETIYDDLTFVKSPKSGYDAELEWLIAVYSEEEKLVFSRSITKNINVTEYVETNSRSKKITLRDEIPLEAGKYKVLLRILDLTTNQSAQRTLMVDIPNYYEEDVAISDILFLKSVQFDSVGVLKDYEPIIGDNFTVRDGEFYIYFNVFSKK